MATWTGTFGLRPANLTDSGRTRRRQPSLEQQRPWKRSQPSGARTGPVCPLRGYLAEWRGAPHAGQPFRRA